MTGKHLYRTLSIIALAAVPAFSIMGCASDGQNKMKQKAQTQWDGARIGVLYQLAEQQYTVGDYDKCRDTLKTAFTSKTPSAPLHVLAAKVELENGSLEAACQHLKTATQIDANNADAYYLLGVVYQRWQNLQAAHDYYNLAYEKRPSEALYLLAVIEMKISLGQNDAAQKLLEDKLVYFEQSSAIRVALAKLSVLKGDYEKAAFYLREATLLSPDSLGIRENYAEALFYGGRLSDAAPVLEDLHRNPDLKNKVNVTMLLGQCYMSLRRPRDARTCFSEITRDNPNNSQAWLCLGRSCIQLDDCGQAAQVARRVLKVEPTNMEAFILLALSQQQLKQWDAAQQTLQQAAEIAPKDTTVLCMEGISEQRMGRQDKAVAIFTRAVKLNPTDTWAQELLANAKPAAPGQAMASPHIILPDTTPVHLENVSAPSPALDVPIAPATVLPAETVIPVIPIIPVPEVQEDAAPAAGTQPAAPADIVMPNASNPVA